MPEFATGCRSAENTDRDECGCDGCTYIDWWHVVDINSTDFALAYARVVARSAADPDFIKRALRSPGPVFRDMGFIPDSVTELKAFVVQHLAEDADDTGHQLSDPGDVESPEGRNSSSADTQTAAPRPWGADQLIGVGTAGSAGTWCGTAAGTFASAVAGITIDSHPSPTSSGARTQAPEASSIGDEAIKSNCVGSFGTAGSFGTWCGTAGSAASAGTYGSAAQAGGGSSSADNLRATAPLSATQLSGMAARTEITSDAIKYNCVGSFGTAGSFGTWCGTAGSAASAGTYGSAAQVGDGSANDMSRPNAQEREVHPDPSQVSESRRSIPARIGSAAAQNEAINSHCWGSAGTFACAGSFCGCAGSAGSAGTYGCGGEVVQTDDSTHLDRSSQPPVIQSTSLSTSPTGVSYDAIKSNCWGSAGTFACAGSFCGCAGSVGSAGTYGTAGGSAETTTRVSDHGGLGEVPRYRSSVDGWVLRPNQSASLATWGTISNT
jgi:hypothetical protein